MDNQKCNFPKCEKETQPNITSVGRPARRQSPVSEPLRSFFRPLSNGNGPSWIWLMMIRLNYGCDKRVRYCAFIFAADIVPSLSTIQWDLKKPACESTEGSARPLKKNISRQTQKWNFWKRPSTDFDKNYIFGIGTSSERLTCPVDWTRSPPPTHALGLCAVPATNTHATTRRGKVWPPAPGLERGSHHRH